MFKQKILVSKYIQYDEYVLIKAHLIVVITVIKIKLAKKDYPSKHCSREIKVDKSWRNIVARKFKGKSENKSVFFFMRKSYEKLNKFLE